MAYLFFFLDKSMKESKQDYQFIGEIMTKHTHIPPFQRNKCNFSTRNGIVKINVIHIHRRWVAFWEWETRRKNN